MKGLRSANGGARVRPVVSERLGQRHAVLGFVIGLVGTLAWTAREQGSLPAVPVTAASLPANRVAPVAAAGTARELQVRNVTDVDTATAEAPPALPAPVPMETAPTEAEGGADGASGYSEDYDAVLARLAAERTLETPDTED
jgi:hypothetical protein